MLYFSKANAKTKNLGLGKVYSLDLPAGYTCPGARDCLSKCVNGKIKDGPHTQFRCFSASQEVTYPAVHKRRMMNLAELRRCKRTRQITTLIMESLPRDANVIRYHVSGDFFKESYFQAALDVADRRPDILFYGYTKSLLHICTYGNREKMEQGEMLPNFFLTASRGGKHDELIDLMSMREARVVFSVEEAEKLGLAIDHDDSHAATIGPSFALLLHGVQPAKTAASIALSALKKLKIGGYSK